MELKDFARSKAAIEEADDALVARIRPLPADVLPSKRFLEQVRLQLSRDPRPLPQLVLKDRGQSLNDYEAEDFAFENYDPHPHISAPVAV